MSDFARQLTGFIRDDLYPGRETIGLHEPTFDGNEREYVLDAIDSTYVSSVGKYVDRFEKMVAEYTGAGRAVAAVNGTAALHAAMHLVGVGRDDLVITQPLTFVATANAIKYCGADPVFLDVDEDSLGLSPTAVEAFLARECGRDAVGRVIHKNSGRRIAACVPMHSFGFVSRIEELASICREWGVPLVEDAAESLGSWVGEKHTGRFGTLGVLSFNGNKTITTGGGGMIITDDETLGARAKHITTTAKVPHKWDFVHDELGFNYRLPNLNAALGCAQMERLRQKLADKRAIHERYREFFQNNPQEKGLLNLLSERQGTTANYWLNAVRCGSSKDRDVLLSYLGEHGVMARPIWELMYRLPAFKASIRGECPMAEVLRDTVVNLPSWPAPAMVRPA